MSVALRVLLVEDSSDDSELLLRQLRLGGYEPIHERVETPRAMAALLDSKAWDIIIADFSMPQFSGMDALALVKQRALDLPFILVSGTIGEDAAVAAMKAGAHDYILKGQLARLVPAVNRELRDAEVRRAHRRSEQDLKASEERLRLALEASHQGTWDWNLLTGEITWSTAVEAMHGLARDTFDRTRESRLALVHPEDQKMYRDTVARAIEVAKNLETEVRVVRPDGSIRWIAESGRVARDGAGRPVRIVGTAMDVTEKKVAGAAIKDHAVEIERANRELERNNQKLSELYSTAQRFVDNVSHEFRTPLTVIKGYAEAMAEGLAGPIGDEQAEFLRFIVDRTRELAQMVDDLLDSSKLRAGTLRVDRKPGVVTDIVSQIRPMLKRAAASNKVSLTERLDDDLPEVFADAEKAGRVIINLVVNAVKFSNEGSEVTLWARENAEGGVEIGVTDHGSGIAPENLALIFERFKQVGDAQRSSNDGFGLGLNIAKELVALNLGKMDVQSTLGEGSTFSFTLPPNDPAKILRQHFNYLVVAATADRVSVLRVGYGTAAPVSSDLRCFVASTVNPLDLILQTADGCSLLIVGCSNDPERFSARLREAMKSLPGRCGDPGPFESIEVELVGAWTYPEGEQDAITRTLDEVAGELIYA